MNSNNKILSVAVVLLLLVNIALVIFMVKGRKSGAKKQRQEPFSIMVKELDMSEQQQADYKSQKEEHFKTIRPLFDSLRSAKAAFFDLIKDSNPTDSLADVYNKRIALQQSQIDKLTFEHFKRVRALFTPEQKPKFDEFIKKMMQRGRKDSAKKK